MQAAPLGRAPLLEGLLAQAEAGCKRWWTRMVPPVVERSAFVLFASLALLLLYWQWRPMTAPIWTVADPVGVMALNALFWLGWALVLVSTFLINHFELFGLSQVYARGSTLIHGKWRAGFGPPARPGRHRVTRRSPSSPTRSARPKRRAATKAVRGQRK